MKTRLHKMATTTPAIRKRIQESDARVSDEEAHYIFGF